MRWAQPILRLSRRACARANDGLASVNAGQPLMKNLSRFVKSVLYYLHKHLARISVQVTIYCKLRIGGDGHLDQSEAYDIS